MVTRPSDRRDRLVGSGDGSQFRRAHRQRLAALRYAGAAPPLRTIALTSFCGYALGNVIGFGGLSSGAVRFRLYGAAGVPAGRIARVTEPGGVIGQVMSWRARLDFAAGDRDACWHPRTFVQESVLTGQEEGDVMRNVVVAIAFTATLGFVGAAAWRAEAVPLTVAPAQADVAKPIQPAACGAPGRHCGPRHHWVCGPYGHHCWCAHC